MTKQHALCAGFLTLTLFAASQACTPAEQGDAPTTSADTTVAAAPDLGPFAPLWPQEPPEPNLCSTAGGDEPEFHPLSDAKPIPDAIAGNVAYQLTFANSAADEFTVTVSGTKSVVPDYVKNSQICAEVQAFPGFDDYEAPPSLPTFILAAMEDQTPGASRSDYAEYRAQEQTTEGDGPSLADIAEHYGADTDDVVDAAVGAAMDEWDLEVNEEEVRAAAEAIVDVPGSPYLIDPADEPMSPDEFPRLAQTDEIVVVEVALSELTTDDVAPYLAVDYVIDPDIRYDERHYYRAHCDQSAWARLIALAGSMSAALWKEDQAGVRQALESTLAAVPEPKDPPRLVKDPPGDGFHTFDTMVSGVKTGDYELHGGWVWKQDNPC